MDWISSARPFIRPVVAFLLAMLISVAGSLFTVVLLEKLYVWIVRLLKLMGILLLAVFIFYMIFSVVAEDTETLDRIIDGCLRSGGQAGTTLWATSIQTYARACRQWTQLPRFMCPRE